ncbi:hypothetical protein SAMN03159463_03057 [Mesorhizobium sp. NFR06]|uniref:hypothetical protein n=1 Tax=Mesorhizobium sp. NFR06 TaxID=1566290 RepID=UPI0008E217C9|nr:hypothetical protein [Mesorhizobium sp. NFR06]SFO81478.1 hypothetical protein SAMN03159463_03057 [Mesorhizobium sp. NFR06]
MEAIFDDIAAALREPRTDLWHLSALRAIDMAGKLFLGIAIGLGVGLGMVIAG